MKLVSVAKLVLREQEDEAEGLPAEIIELPHDNMTISVFRDKKVLSFVPQFHKLANSGK